MLELYADENFELPVIKKLRAKGYDILTALRVNALKFSILENCHKPGIDLTFKKHESFVRR